MGDDVFHTRIPRLAAASSWRGSVSRKRPCAQPSHHYGATHDLCHAWHGDFCSTLNFLASSKAGTIPLDEVLCHAFPMGSFSFCRLPLGVSGSRFANKASFREVLRRILGDRKNAKEITVVPTYFVARDVRTDTASLFSVPDSARETLEFRENMLYSSGAEGVILIQRI